ncbi:hypothetical protein C8Q72DRAFT_844538 [Fomitopsis betulina]|nr:hypothetical protein C8Q72DRAFT_844538 [Fomitopsis betulina]
MTSVDAVKSDARKAFGLTDKEVASLPYMGFSGSSKTIYRLADCKALADRKHVTLGSDAFDYPARTQPPEENSVWGLSSRRSPRRAGLHPHRAGYFPQVSFWQARRDV